MKKDFQSVDLRVLTVAEDIVTASSKIGVNNTPQNDQSAGAPAQVGAPQFND